ncbi:hypothetical protein DPEC_G00207450 [Dallia pectoralis]|uniref:Uncharacterized protein n=1 Tax=Dallia pectoralis TaxID=75939 RepID=A0ACC2G570_DALPE|nr:hypothetical protein DPEC_G00207450 [Dallia pectoralis]
MIDEETPSQEREQQTTAGVVQAEETASSLQETRDKDGVGQVEEEVAGPSGLQGIDPSSSEYLRTIDMCWNKSYYAQQKRAMEEFMSLQTQHKVVPHVTLEDMKYWLTLYARGTFRSEFLKEIDEGMDLSICELLRGSYDWHF